MHNQIQHISDTYLTAHRPSHANAQQHQKGVYPRHTNIQRQSLPSRNHPAHEPGAPNRAPKPCAQSNHLGNQAATLLARLVFLTALSGIPCNPNVLPSLFLTPPRFASPAPPSPPTNPNPIPSPAPPPTSSSTTPSPSTNPSPPPPPPLATIMFLCTPFPTTAKILTPPLSAFPSCSLRRCIWYFFRTGMRMGWSTRGVGRQRARADMT